MLPLIFAAVTAIASITGTYLFTRNHYETILAERTAAHATAMAAATANALAETKRLQTSKDEAERKAKIRLTAARRDAAASRDALIGMSDAADSALRSASDSHSACVANANSLTVVLGRCAGALQDMGEVADGWHNESLTLREAWPKKE